METTVKRIQFPELFYGIVAPIGVNIDPTIESLKASLNNKGYNVVTLKVTDSFKLFKRKFQPHVELRPKPYFNRVNSYISYGNQLRWNFSDQAILGAAAVYQVNEARAAIISKDTEYNFEKTAYIIHQFKRREEIELLRAVYGVLFTQISIYSSRENRIDFLSRRIASEASSSIIREHRPQAETLVNRDQDEVGEFFGQRVSKIFHEADIIINNDISSPSTNAQVERVVDLQFGSNGISPTKLEYGMFLAKSAALRTLDLSRQVGAAIFSKSGEIIALGSNEVPKAGGGTYWSDEVFDDREYMRGVDSNDVRKKDILKNLFDEIRLHKGIKVDIDFDDFASSEQISASRFMDALEYGRIIHAEMSSLMDAARLGRPTKDASLYCTTFPCHICAKHIVASGIASVTFLEPYPKSLAEDLHSDSIRIEGAHRGKYNEFPAVHFEHFFGVTPRNYIRLFSRSKRKKGEKFQAFQGGVQRPIADIKAPLYITFENKLSEESTKKFKFIKPRSLKEFNKQKEERSFS